MSYNVRDDNALFGPLAGVELPNGAGQSTVVAHQVIEPVGLFGMTATTFPASSFMTVFIAPPNPSTANGIVPLGQKYQVVGGTYYYKTAAGSAATFTVEIVPAGTADGSGNNVLSVTNVALNSVASTTPTALSLNSNVDNLILLPNSRLNVNSGATATTSLVNFCIQLYVARIA